MNVAVADRIGEMTIDQVIALMNARKDWQTRVNPVGKALLQLEGSSHAKTSAEILLHGWATAHVIALEDPKDPILLRAHKQRIGYVMEVSSFMTELLRISGSPLFRSGTRNWRQKFFNRDLREPALELWNAWIGTQGVWVDSDPATSVEINWFRQQLWVDVIQMRLNPRHLPDLFAATK